MIYLQKKKLITILLNHSPFSATKKTQDMNPCFFSKRKLDHFFKKLL